MRKASLKGATNLALLTLNWMQTWRIVNEREIMKANEATKPAEIQIMPQLEATLGRGLSKIVLGSTALALGCMAAALQSLQRGASGFTFHVSLGTFAACALGMAAGLLYWKLAAGTLWAVRLGTAFLLLAGVGGFLYPLRFVRADKMSEIAIGLAFATCAISMVALLLWKLKGFFDADAAAAEAKQVN
jgi:hypothetical protein